MSINKKIIVGLVVILVIAIGGLFYPQSKTILQNIGAAPGQDFPLEVTTTNGRSVAQGRFPLARATTTPCAVQSPSATSTLRFANVQIDTASSTATVWTVAKANTRYATTTYLDSFALASGAQGSMTYLATSTSLGDFKAEIKPNTFIVWGVAGIVDALTSDKLLGSCSYEFSIH